MPARTRIDAPERRSGPYNPMNQKSNHAGFVIGSLFIDAGLANDLAPFSALVLDERAELGAWQVVHVEALHDQLLLYQWIG